MCNRILREGLKNNLMFFTRVKTNESNAVIEAFIFCFKSKTFFFTYYMKKSHKVYSQDFYALLYEII